MHCPYCQQSVAEQSVQCAVCGLDLERLDGLLGIPPVLQAGLTDSAGVLPAKAARQVRAALRQFRERFPQIQLALLVEEAPDKVPMRTWVWWLFNRSRFSLALDKGFVNRDILLVLDPGRRQVVVTIGYGLEPFVGKRDLADALAAGQPALAAGDWGEACGEILVALDDAFRQIIDRMSRAYGVPVPLLQPQTGEEEPAAVW
jgi:hypothetical protein